MFADREDAARQLVEKLKPLQLLDPLVLAIPRGGVVTGAVLARELGADLDVVLSRKLRAPYQPELAIGAVGEDGEVYLNHRTDVATSIDQAYIEKERQYQISEIARRQKIFRAARPQAPVAGRSVILTDDGIATGSTMIAALRAVRKMQPAVTVAAVPVAPPEGCENLRAEADDAICLHTPMLFYAVGQFYDDFEQTSDEEAIALLRAREKEIHGG